MFGKSCSRDTLKQNKKLISIAIAHLGLRVAVPTCQVHVRELYAYMEVSCPRYLALACSTHIWILILYMIDTYTLFSYLLFRA